MKKFEIIEELKNKNIHLVGISSAEGSALAEFLLQQGVKKIVAHDFKEEDEFENNFYLTHQGYSYSEKREKFEKLIKSPIRINFRDSYLKEIEKAQAIFVTQGWYLYENNAILHESKKKGIKFFSMTQLYFDLAPCPIIAVTGTNGKSTTSRLIYEMLSNSQFNTYFAGNDRLNIQVLDKLIEMKPSDFLVLEVSNRQLRDLKKSPHIAVITNITPDHLDEHGTFEDYVQTKEVILKYQKKEDFAVLNDDNESTREMIDKSRGSVFPFSRRGQLSQGAFLENDEMIIKKGKTKIAIGDISLVKIPGQHNVENVLAASMAACLSGAGGETITNTIKDFKGVKFRIERVREINNVNYYNDVKGTTPQACLAAIESFKAPIILIAGGGDKGLDYNDFARRIMSKIKLLILMPGKGSKKIEKAIKNISYHHELKVKHRYDLSEAVQLAHQSSEKGDTVLLSPACPYFYSMFIEGRKGFEKLVRELK